MCAVCVCEAYVCLCGVCIGNAVDGVCVELWGFGKNVGGCVGMCGRLGKGVGLWGFMGKVCTCVCVCVYTLAQAC